MDICCICYECLRIFVLNSIWICLRVRCPFWPPKYHFEEQKRTPHFETSLYVENSFFTRNFESRLYHFLFFVILMKLFWTFWWAIEEKILCSSYAAGMLFWKRHNYRFAKRYGSWLKIKKNQTACIRSSEKTWKKSEGKQTLAISWENFIYVTKWNSSLNIPTRIQHNFHK